MKLPSVRQNQYAYFVAAIIWLILGDSLSLRASTDTWNGGGAPDGNWSNTANWLSGTAPNAAGDNLLFSGSVQPLSTNDSVTSVGWVQLNPSVPFAISGQIMAISSGLTNSALNNNWNVPLTNMVNQNFDVAANTVLTMGGAISATAAFWITNNDQGTLVLSGGDCNTNMHVWVNNGTVVLNKNSSTTVHALGGASGPLEYVNGGTLQLSGTGGDQISSGGWVVIKAGAFDLNGQSEAINGIDFETPGLGAITNSSSSAAMLTWGGSSSSSAKGTVGGVGDITLNGGGRFRNVNPLTKVGGDTLTLAFTGSGNSGLILAVNSGTVVLADPSSTSSANSVGGVTVNSGATVRLGGGGGYQIAPGATPVVSSGGVLDMSGINQTFTSGAGLTINGTGVGAGALINSSGTASTLTGTGTSALTLGSSSSVGGSGNLTISGVVSGSGISLTKVGSGTLTLSSMAGYSGNTTISGGTLAFVASGGVTSPILNVNSNTVLDVSGTSSTYSLVNQTLCGGGFVNGNISAVVSGAQISPGAVQPGSTLTFSNSLTVGGSSIIFNLSSSPSGSNDQISVLGALAINSPTTVLLNYQTGTLNQGTYTLMTYQSLSGSAGNFSLGSTYPNVTLNVGSTAMTLTVGSGGSSLRNLTWQGDGVANQWDLVATNWLNGATPAVFSQYDNINFNDGGSYAPDISLTGALTPSTVTINNSNTSYALSGSGQLSNIIGLFKNGPGIFTIKNTNSYTAVTVINDGTLVFAGSDVASPINIRSTLQLGNGGTVGTVGTNAITFLADDSALMIDRSDSPVVSSQITFGGSGNNNSHKNSIIVSSGATATINGGINDAIMEEFWINDSNDVGTLIVNEPTNTFNNSVVINGGVLAVADLSNGGSSSSLGEGLIFNRGATLRYTGPSAGCDRIGVAAFQITNCAIDVASLATKLTIPSAMGQVGSSSSVSFIKLGLGTLELAGANTFTCPTIVSNGTLMLSDAVLGGNVSVQSGATLLVNVNVGPSTEGTVAIYSNGILGGNGYLGNGATLLAGGIIQGGDEDYLGTLSAPLGPINFGPSNAPATTYSQFNIAAGGDIDAADGLNISGTNVVNILDAALAVGQYTLITHEGGINYGSAGAFQLGALPANVQAHLVDTNNEIDLVVDATNVTPPLISTCAILPDKNFELTFTGTSNAGYTIRATTNLNLSPITIWTVLGGGTFGSSPIVYEDITTTNYPQRFYVITSP